MDERGIVKFRVTVEHMRRELVHALMLDRKEYEAQVERAVAEAMANFRFDEAFHAGVRTYVNDEVNRLAYQAVRQAFDTPGLRDAVIQDTITKLQERLSK